MLEVSNLTKVYADGTVALRNVSFQVEDGEFLAIEKTITIRFDPNTKDISIVS